MKNHLMKLLFLLALCPIFASRTVAQDPYDLEDWACSPTSCTDSEGPIRTGAVSVAIAGTCFNGTLPNSPASAQVINCAVPYLLGARGQTLAKLIEVNNTMYNDEGVQANSGIWDSTGEELWFAYAYIYCDGWKKAFHEIGGPC